MGGAGIGVREQAHVAASADAADTHHLPSGVEDVIALEQGPSVGWQGRGVGRDHLPPIERFRVEVADQGRIIDDLPGAVDDAG
jgi:hypothetical protein